MFPHFALLYNTLILSRLQLIFMLNDEHIAEYMLREHFKVSFSNRFEISGSCFVD